jgi:hypothetical protein
MESQKYKPGGSNDVITNDGGTLASVYEKGTKTGLEPLDYGDSSLVGYWTFDEGSSSVAYDYSGNNATGSWSGTQAGTNGYYSAGKVGSWAGYFNGSNDYVGVGSSINPTSQFSLIAWVDLSSPSCGASAQCGFMGNANYQVFGLNFGMLSGNYLDLQTEVSGGASNLQASTAPLSVNSWTQVAATFNGSIGTLYVNGAIVATGTLSAPVASTYSFTLGRTTQGGWIDFLGLIDDVRIYNRALSAAEISALYNGGK